MNSDRLRRIEELYHGVLACPGSARENFLVEACAGDLELKAEVDSLIAHADAEPDRLFLPIAEAVVSTFAARLAPGDRLGPYTVVDFLGAGGMGEVYCARDPRLQRDVAIKVLPAAEVAPDRQRRLLAEARAAGALNHPNILTVYDVGVHAESPFIVSELLRGETLRQAISRGPLSVPMTLELGIEIARGCAAAHEHGIVHRDLKPENLFVTRDGRVKILDFGLARQTSAAVPVASSAETATQVVPQTPTLESPASAKFGTAGYMSPEQVRGERIDHRADIFALGAILYEMATGHRAFARPSNADAMRAVLSDEPPVMTSSHSIPAGLESIVRRCLAKNPADRFQS
ncbi:MAG TPA: serine/threonine-protein kinase, partial [Vicinamibacterales bacterium]|nr:serine/threonine-protein kinase [Vicinamibacterales bacterium]